MAAEEKAEETPEAPKPVKRVKKVLRETPPPPAEEAPAPKPRPKPAAKSAPKATAAKAPEAKPAAKPRPAKKVVPEPAPEEAAEETPKAPPEKAPAEKKAKKVTKPKAKAEEEEKEEAEEGEEEAEEHVARAKPELPAEVKAAIRLRRVIASRRPTFYRQEWWRYPRLGLKWRKPQGGQSKLRRHYGYRINVVSIGYRGPRAARGLHPSGFAEVLVQTPRELKAIDPKRQAARIGGTVGRRLRALIEKEAEDLGVRILNRREE